MQDIDGRRIKRPKQPYGFRIGLRIRLRRAGRVHTVWYHLQAFGRNQTIRKNFVARGDTVTGHSSSFAETAQNATSHTPERTRAAICRGFENTPERIQIVAGHDDAIRWKAMHELSVAVIHNMEQIKIALLAHPQRIIEK